MGIISSLLTDWDRGILTEYNRLTNNYNNLVTFWEQTDEEQTLLIATLIDEWKTTCSKLRTEGYGQNSSKYRSLLKHQTILLNPLDHPSLYIVCKIIALFKYTKRETNKLSYQSYTPYNMTHHELGLVKEIQENSKLDSNTFTVIVDKNLMYYVTGQVSV